MQRGFIDIPKSGWYGNSIHMIQREEKTVEVAVFTDYAKKIVSNCSRVIVGKEDVIEKILVCFICSGHLLLED